MQTPSRSPAPITETPNVSPKSVPISKDIVDKLVKTLYVRFPKVTNDYVEAREHLKDALTSSLKDNYGEYKITLYCYPLSAISSKLDFHFIGAYGDNYEIPWNMAYNYGFLMIKMDFGKGSWLKYVWVPASFSGTKNLLMHHNKQKVEALFGTIENKFYTMTYTDADLRSAKHVVKTYQDFIENTCKITKKRYLSFAST